MNQRFSMLTTLLFDLDGTLANTDPVHFLTWQDLLRPHGFELDLPFYQAHFSGRRNDQIVAELLPHLSADEGAQFSRQKEAEFRCRADQLTLMPGLSDLFGWMEQRNLKRAIVTNAPVENARFMMEALNVVELFPTVVLGDDLPRGKPDPLPYLTALKHVGATAVEAIAFEDSPSGLRSAVAANIPTVAIASTHEPEALYDLGATLVISDFTDPRLWALLNQLTTPPSEVVSASS